MRRERRPTLPELSEFEVQRHYLHLAQETLGMMGISLFGTCTMKYNPRVGEEIVARPEIAELHPHQHDDTLQGVLEIIHGLDLILRELSGMDQFVFQAGRRRRRRLHARLRDARLPRRRAASSTQRDEIITTIQAHPCNAATAAAAGFKVVTLPLEEDGYPSLDALRAAVSDRTAALMVNNPDDMGIYNPDIDEWVEIVHDGGRPLLLRPRQLQRRHGQDPRPRARLRRLHVHAPQDVRRAQGRRRPGRRRVRLQRGAGAVPAGPDRHAPTATATASTQRPESLGKVREFCGNVPQIVKAYAWARAMGADGIREASDLSVIAQQLHGGAAARDPRASRKSHPGVHERRMEMTRYGLGTLTEETGVDRARRAEPHGRLRRSTRPG